MILGKKNMNWIKNYKLSKRFYKKVFSKISYDSNESFYYSLDQSRNEGTWYCNTSSE